MKELKLTNSNLTAKIDDHNFDRCNVYSWHLINGYAARTIYTGSYEKEIIYLHQFITGLKFVDHRDNNSLNNLESNLRKSNKSLNAFNTKKLSIKCTSKYKGVSWIKKAKKWQAMIKYKGVAYFLGYFTDEILAAIAYDDKALEFAGEHAQLNFPLYGA